ncbi:MAG: protein kinase domain-containing protein [Gemmatimonadota bacterium]
MRPEDWDRIEESFHRLAPLDPASRSVELAEVSAEDPELAREIESLLIAHDSESGLDRLTEKVAPRPMGPGQPASLEGSSIGHYEVGALIGRGGMGDVYRGRDPRLDREVALKLLPPWLGRDPSARERFLVEARVVSSIDHPNVCTLLEMGETDDGRLFLVMPFYRGQTLKTRLSSGALPVEEAIDVALQSARGLAAAHERGVVHRDVKPANLLLTEPGRVKILDFGVAKLVDVSLTRPGQHPGTAQYMAPEQASGAEVDARTDLWSLGAVLYEMLTGERPGPASAVRAGLESVPAVLAELVGRLLAESPADRYPDARSLAEDLEVLASGEGALSAPPAPSITRFLAELKRRHVFRVAAVYGVMGFAVMEAADVMFPRIALPEWTVGLVVWLVLLGFPIGIVLAWAFEVTPGGVRRTRSVRPAILDAIAGQPASRRWPVGLAGLLGGALLVGAAWISLDRSATSRVGLASGVQPPGLGESQGTRPSLAVLPFLDLTQSEGTRSFVDGIHGDLLTQLYKLGSLKVISRTSVLEYRDSPKNAREIARELGAETLLEGDVQQVGERFRINLQLIDADTDSHLWAETYEGELSIADVFSVQNQIARSVAGALASTLTSDERESLERVPTRNLEAYEDYQEARVLILLALEAGGPASLQKADRLLSDAIARDAGFAEAYALRSVIASLRYMYLYDPSPSTAAAADSFSRRALQLAPDLPEGHAARARYFWIRFDFARALDHVERARQGSPGDAALLRLEGHLLLRGGQVRDAHDRYLGAAELDPRDGMGVVWVGRTYLLLREYDPAREWLLRARDLRPERGTTYHELSFLELLEDGDTAAARAWLDEARRLGVYNPRLGYTYVELEMVARQPAAAIERVQSWPHTENSNQYRHVPRDLALAFAYRLAGDSVAARRHFQTAREVTRPLVEENPGDARYRGALGLALAGLGRAGEAIQQGEEALRLLPPTKQLWTGGWRVHELAAIYAMSGRVDEAIEQLERLLSIPSDVSAALLRIDPIWDPLRDDPRFRSLVAEP